CKKEHFITAIGYLIRRLDENTGPENFLRHAFKIKAGSKDWKKLEQGFLSAQAAMDRVSDAPRRTQNRQLPPVPIAAVTRAWQHFENEPDTDFSLRENGEWAQQIVAKWQPRTDANAVQIPLVIGGRELLGYLPVRECLDPSRLKTVVGYYRQAPEADIQQAVA